MEGRQFEKKELDSNENERKSISDEMRMKWHWNGKVTRVFLISVCRAKFGESRNLEKMIGTPPLDDQMNISLQKNVLNSLQPPKTASTGPKFCCSQKVSFLKGSFRCSPNHIQHWNMECHTPLERSRIAFYGYVNFWSPNQTIWWPGAIEGFWRQSFFWKVWPGRKILDIGTPHLPLGLSG